MTTKADYIIALLRELERIRPSAKWNRQSHVITWRGEDLLLLVNVGDALQIHEIDPADLSDDPAETAQRLLSHVQNMMDAEPADFIFFKR